MIKNKSRLALGLILAIYAMPCFGIFSIEDLDATSHRSHYNTLPKVEDADANLKACLDFQDFLSKAEQVIISHGFEDIVGLRLIHHHFDLGAEQVMVENFELYDGIPSLITSAQPITVACEKGAAPSSWIFDGSQRVVFEFSADPAVKAGLRRIQEAPDFLMQIKKTIEDYNLQNLLAIALLRKDTLVPDNSEVYLEKNYVEDGKSIVQLSPLEDASLHIRTSWGFSGPKQNRCFCSGHWCSKGSDGKGAHKRFYGPHVDL